MTTRVAKLSIPNAAGDVAVYCAQALNLLRQSDAHVYFDTSFLMFLTRIGGHSRGALFTWLDGICAGRLHTPSWAVHEYLRHYGEGTLPSSVGELCSRIEKISKDSFALVRECLDDASGPTHDAQVRSRATLINLETLREDLLNSKSRLQTNAGEVIEFMNRTSLGTGSIFGEMYKIQQEGAGRYEGRIPPGFKDEKKKPLKSIDHAAGEVVERGANRFGDLHFWQEVLEHARQLRARSIIILSNDRKSDWLMPGIQTAVEDSVSKELGAENMPVPLAHPMLQFEAQITSGVEELVILDRHFLAQTIRRDCPDVNAPAMAFVKVAVNTKTPRNQNSFALRQSQVQSDGVPSKTVVEGPLWTDPDDLPFSPGILRKALVESRRPIAAESPAGKLLAAVADAVANNRSIADLFGLDATLNLREALVSVARRIHDSALNNDQGFKTGVADLIGVLPKWPLNSAAFVYLGFLASAYLQQDSGDMRAIPNTPDAAALFGLQGLPFAEESNKAFRMLYEKKAKPFVYIPSSQPPEIKVEFISTGDPDTMLLSHIQIQGFRLTTELQFEDALSINPTDQVSSRSIGDLLPLVSRIFCLPINQLVADRALDQMMGVPPRIGFVDAVDLIEGAQSS